MKLYQNLFLVLARTFLAKTFFPLVAHSFRSTLNALEITLPYFVCLFVKHFRHGSETRKLRRHHLCGSNLLQKRHSSYYTFPLFTGTQAVLEHVSCNFYLIFFVYEREHSEILFIPCVIKIYSFKTS